MFMNQEQIEGMKIECRIQISKSKNFNEALSSNNEVVVFGYFADEKVFTAWNPYWLRERFNKRQTISKYSRFSVQRKASTEGIASYIDNNDETIISFKPDYLGLYLDNISNIHLLNESNLLELIKLSDKSNYDNFEKEYPIEKEKYQVTHKRYKER